MKIRTFEPGDELRQATVYNLAAGHLPGFRPASADDVRRRTRGRSFDPATRFFAEANGQTVGYCVLEPATGRIGFPWCQPGYESAAPLLLEAALRAARDRGLTRLFAAYRRDWSAVLDFFARHGFHHARDIINYWADPAELPTYVHRRSRVTIDRLRQEDLPALAAMGRGLLRLTETSAELQAYFFAHPTIPAEAYFVLRDPDGITPRAVGLGVENPSYPDVRQVDPLAPCFRLGAFGTEGLSTKRVNGLFSFLVADPGQTPTAGLSLLAEISQELTNGSVAALAAQCPSDVPHLVAFYHRYFREQGRFPVLEMVLL